MHSRVEHGPRGGDARWTTPDYDHVRFKSHAKSEIDDEIGTRPRGLYNREPMNNRRTMRVLITGASGYIGGRLVAIARARGHDIVAGVRDPRLATSEPGMEWRAFDLREGSADAAVRGVGAVIHLATVLDPNGRSSAATEDVNVLGTRALLEAARREGVRRFVFISSQSAAANSPTSYGQSKFAIEQLLTGQGECAVRTGLVCGGPPRGLYGTLLRLCKRSPVLPLLRTGAPVHPVHVDDVCDRLLSLIESEREPPRLVRLAAGAVRFGDFVRALAWQRLGRRVTLVPIPVTPLVWLARVASRFPSLPAISRERILGLGALRAMDATIPAVDAERPLRDVDRALALEGNRRRLLAEGGALMRYVAGRHASRGVVRRYVRAIQASGDAGPLGLGAMVQAWPQLLRLSEPIGAPSSARLSRRLALATRIVEMTPQAAPLFHEYRERTRLWGWLELIWLLAVETVLMPARWIAGRRWRRDPESRRDS